MEIFDFVFVNFNFFDFVKEVFWWVGYVVFVSWYYLNLLNVRKWFSVIMDGFFYLVSRIVIDVVYLCCDCEIEVLKLK